MRLERSEAEEVPAIDPLLQGIPWILRAQSLGGTPGEVFFTLMTLLGGRWWILPSLPFLWFLLPWKSGARISLFVILSTLVNYILKDAFSLPRPFHLREGLNLIAAAGHGLPSGHAQAAVVYWGTLARELRRRWFAGIAGFIVLMVGLSRVYLGVHFPADVLAGWILGGVLLAGFAAAEPRVKDAFQSLPRAGRLGAALGGPLLAMGLHPAPETAGLLGGLAGFTVGLTLREPARRAPLPASVGGRLPRAGVAFGGGALLLGAATAILGGIPDGTAVDLGLRFGANLVLGGWLSWFSFRTMRWTGIIPAGMIPTGPNARSRDHPTKGD